MKITIVIIIFHHLFSKSYSDPAFGGFRTAFATDDGGSSPSPPPPDSDESDKSDSSKDEDDSPPSPPLPPPPPPPPPPAPDTFSTDPKASLTIYYDPLDENSRKFFATSLEKQSTFFSTNINLSFVPCQQAEVKEDLICTQVDESCRVDKTHSCAIKQITDKTLLVNYLTCAVFDASKPSDFSKCASSSKANNDNIEKCVNADEGKNLCKDYCTRKLPGLDTLPGFIFKTPGEIKTGEPYEYMDYYRRSVCVNDLHSAVCAKLVASKSPNVPEECKKKLVLGIFYQVMQDKSRKWFQSFSQVYDEFSNYLVLQFQPCMFSEPITDGSGTLHCGGDVNAEDIDCTTGKTHACAALLIQDPKSLFRFFNCSMQDTKKPPDFEKCAVDNGIQYDPIKQCASTDQGIHLCLACGKTRPKCDDIPSFSYELTFDGDASKKTADATGQTLRTVLCDQFKKYGIDNPCDHQDHGGGSNTLPNVPPTEVVKAPPASHT